ncbi:MAG: hypothetical protein U0414_28065 [Polyangiaceae bacterium]
MVSPRRRHGPTSWIVAISALGLAACGDKKLPPVEGSSSAAPVNNAPIKIIPPTNPASDAEPNPLSLPPRPLDVVVGQRIFAPPAAMLRGAKLGSSLALRAVEVVAKDGDTIVVQGRDGPNYKVHTAYVIPVPPNFRPRVNGPVLAEWAGQLRHGALRRMNMGSAVIRFTDTEDKTERTLKNGALIAQTDGFRPGNFAGVREGDALKQVMLVSELGDGSRRWFALGYAGAAMLVDPVALVAVPVNFEPKEGASVWGVWLGAYRPATIQDVDSPGLFTVRFDRTGRAVRLGWGSVMPPFAPLQPIPLGSIPMPKKPPRPDGSFM